MKRLSIQGKRGNALRCTWSRQEDKALKTAVKLYKTKGWNCIATYVNSCLPKDLPQKNANQCRERWSNQLNPEVCLGSLNKDEIALVFELHEELGNRWSAIAAKLPGRTDNIVKNWFLCKLRKLSRCIKKESVLLELPESQTELLQTLYMLDYLYKYYLALDRFENIAKSLNSQNKKRKNDGDRYINRMVESGMIDSKKLNVFIKILLSEVRFNIDKILIQKYEYLLDLDRLDSECSASHAPPSGDVKSEAGVSTLLASTEERMCIELPLPNFAPGLCSKPDQSVRPLFDFAVYSVSYKKTIGKLDERGEVVQ
eukprot:TRINITY_DN9202_c0_g1_i4.p1 TRINITY_DN9202_c0_g1~~TRINITY_DN9202_c0_g1_i4.p1  ORF type:complete len:313 (-),score=86.46 TRINITY_DN9202_c0_g1_i4:205-1143(-)